MLATAAVYTAHKADMCACRARRPLHLVAVEAGQVDVGGGAAVVGAPVAVHLQPAAHPQPRHRLQPLQGPWERPLRSMRRQSIIPMICLDCRRRCQLVRQTASWCQEGTVTPWPGSGAGGCNGYSLRAFTHLQGPPSGFH
jgi:hypothetical protein